jgi:hypothetical protein
MTAESLGEDERRATSPAKTIGDVGLLTQALLLANARSGHTQQAEANGAAASSRRNPAAPKREVAPSPRGYLFSGVTSVDGSSDD